MQFIPTSTKDLTSTIKKLFKDRLKCCRLLLILGVFWWHSQNSLRKLSSQVMHISDLSIHVHKKQHLVETLWSEQQKRLFTHNDQT